jgi:hypothetical protein
MKNSNEDMPNLNNLEKMFGSVKSSKRSSPNKRSPTLSDILGKSPGRDNFNWNYIEKALTSKTPAGKRKSASPALSLLNDYGRLNAPSPTLSTQKKPARKIAPKAKPARKIAPKAKPARKIAPKAPSPLMLSRDNSGRSEYIPSGLSTPARKIVPKALSPLMLPRDNSGRSDLSTPDRQFGHKFDGMNTGEKDDKGRIIYAGKRGGKFVISSSGARVPYLHNKLKNRLDKGKYPFTGKVDRNGLKVFKGPRGGLFVVDSKSGKKKNPLMPLRDA